jgi:[ribosomal protein S5]-alanine N-acetyltransferase
MEIPFGEWKLRSWQDSDETALVKYADNRKLWLNMQDFFPYPYTLKDAQEWVRKAKGMPDTCFAIASAVEAIGSISLNLQPDILCKSADVGCWLGEPFWNRGIGTEATKVLVKYAFANFDLVRLFALVFASNPASRHVLEKTGFQLEARLAKSVFKDGKIMDSFLYALIRDEGK